VDETLLPWVLGGLLVVVVLAIQIRGMVQEMGGPLWRRLLWAIGIALAAILVVVLFTGACRAVFGTCDT
jgi:hypothetical protein